MATPPVPAVASLAKVKSFSIMPLSSSSSRPRPGHSLKLKPVFCAPLKHEVEVGIMCESCNGKGWLVCDFCGGQKTNVKAQNNRIYRRCPTCRAVGYVLCSKCKVFKCVTFPNYDDGLMGKHILNPGRLWCQNLASVGSFSIIFIKSPRIDSKILALKCNGRFDLYNIVPSTAELPNYQK